jgi:hypothetical protein
MRSPSVFSVQLRGFRIVDLVGVTLFLVVALANYALKTLAGSQDANAADVETQILLERKRIKLLKVEIAHLSNPARVVELSRQRLTVGPVDAQHDISAAALPALVDRPALVAHPASKAAPP